LLRQLVAAFPSEGGGSTCPEGEGTLPCKRPKSHHCGHRQCRLTRLGSFPAVSLGRGTMRLRAFALGLCAAVVLAAVPGAANADPSNSPLSVTLTANCETGPVTMTFLHNPSPLGWTASTSVGVIVSLTAKDAVTGEIIAQFEIPGFNTNGVPTQTCVADEQGMIVTADLLFTPASSGK